MMPRVGPDTALLLDIDGTLLDMALSPERVVVPVDLVRALDRLGNELSGALAFVSGRSLESIDRLFAPLKPAAIGATGARSAALTAASCAPDPCQRPCENFFCVCREVHPACCSKTRAWPWLCIIGSPRKSSPS